MPEGVMQIVAAAVIVEAVWETLKMTYKNGELTKERIGGLVFGFLVAGVYGINIPAAVGLEAYWPVLTPYVGMLLTGILISRGANAIHDVLDRLNLIKNARKKKK